MYISWQTIKTINKHFYDFNLISTFYRLKAHFKKMYLLTQTVQLTTKSIHFFIKTHFKNPTLLHKKKKKKRKNTQETKNTSSSTWFMGICENPTTNITLHGRKLDVFPPKIRKKKRMSIVTTSTWHYTGSSSQGN